MKTRFFALAALALALVACNNDNENLNGDPVAAQFTANIAPATRASGTTWTAGDRIGAVEHLSFGLADEARTVHGKPYAYDVMLVEPSDGTYTFTPPPPSPLEHRRQSSLRAPMTSIQGSMPDSSFKSPRCCFSMRSRTSSLSRICF